MQNVKELNVDCAHAKVQKTSLLAFLWQYIAKSVTTFFDSQCLGVLHIVEEN